MIDLPQQIETFLNEYTRYEQNRGPTMALRYNFGFDHDTASWMVRTWREKNGR